MCSKFHTPVNRVITNCCAMTCGPVGLPGIRRRVFSEQPHSQRRPLPKQYREFGLRVAVLRVSSLLTCELERPCVAALGNSSISSILLGLTLQVFAQKGYFRYFSNQNYCIFQYITDSIRLIPLCILLLLHWLCPAKSFFEHTTLGVSHYETHRPRFRRCPGPHRRSRLHADLFCLYQEQGHCGTHEHAARSELRSG